jgi:hypothetical protein
MRQPAMWQEYRENHHQYQFLDVKREAARSRFRNAGVVNRAPPRPLSAAAAPRSDPRGHQPTATLRR